MTSEDQELLRRVLSSESDEDESVGELQVADYILLLFAFDSYAAHLTELGIDVDSDDYIQKGLRILRQIDAQQGSSIEEFLFTRLERDASKNQVRRTFSVRVTNDTQAGRRAVTLRTVLNQGGAATLRILFEEARARKEVKAALTAHVMDDPAVALTRYSAVQIQNLKIRSWVQGCVPRLDAVSAENATNVVSDQASPVGDAASVVADVSRQLKESKLRLDSSMAADVQQAAQAAQARTIQKAQEDATEAAKRSMEASGKSDGTVTRSEAIGIATAAAIAAATEVGNEETIPEPLKALDPEQRSAALTDGKVIVAAGAGSGKSFTLVRRVQFLVQDRNVNPARIMVSSFNNKAAEELKHKIGNAVGNHAASAMKIGTFHSVFLWAVRNYGSPDERLALTEGSIGNGKAVASEVTKLWRKLHAIVEDGVVKDATPPKMSNVMRHVNKWSGNDISPDQAMALATTEEAREAAEWYRLYEGFKGNLGLQWRPEMGNNEEAQVVWRKFLEKFRVKNLGGKTKNIRLGDFGDMIKIFRDVLKRDPSARKALQGLFDHIMVDECQDLDAVQHEALSLLTGHVSDGSDGKSFWMVGDDKQCVSVDTDIQISFNETKKARDLKEGDDVLAYRNGDFTTQKVRHIVPSSWTEGVVIETMNGKKLHMSPNHKIWASLPYIENLSLIYLMWREDMGFRVGVTNKTFSRENPFGNRPRTEKADRLWVLGFEADRDLALFRESSISLQYGIPTQVFKAANRGISQSRVDKIFKAFGENGRKLLKDLGLSFDHPNWFSCGTTRHETSRRLINVVAHSPKNTQVRMEWTGSQFDRALADAGISYTTTERADYRRIRKYFDNYRSALSFCETLRQITSSPVRERLSVCGEERSIPLVTAASLIPGMVVAVVDLNGFIDTEQIISVKKAPGEFLDLDVEDASNFVGGGILSHNSIYSFRGARPDLFVGTTEKEDWKVRTIRTNYRCAPEIVDHANRLIAHNNDQIKMEANPAPGRAKGQASILVEPAQDEADAAVKVSQKIEYDVNMAKKPLTDMAILTRTNAELHSYEMALLIKGIPYARKGASSFLNSPEIQAVLGYMTLATDTDPEKLQSAFVDALLKPNKFFLRDGKVACQASVDRALEWYARRNGVPRKTVNPLEALRDKAFGERLLSEFGFQGYRLQKSMSTLDTFSDALSNLQVMSQDESVTTKDFLDEIMNVPGVQFGKNVDGRLVEVRSSLLGDIVESALLKVSDDEEDEAVSETPEQAAKGNVSFLYELAKTNPTDEADLQDPPSTPYGFWKKMDRLKAKSKDLRIDIEDWEKTQNNVPIDERQPPPGVLLSTVHRVKGAQWPTVYVQMPKGVFPRKDEAAINLGSEPELVEAQLEDLEADRRLAYVAITRPSQDLHIVCPSTVNGRPAGVSSFVLEAGLSMGENVDVATASDETLNAVPEFLEDDKGAA